MFVVYDLACNGLREPAGVTGAPTFSWRLGSDRAGTRQAAWRIVVTSVRTGSVAWDSGRVVGQRPRAVYAGERLEPDEQCVWFVTAWDDEDEQAHGTPSAFACGSTGDRLRSSWGRQRVGMVWTSDERLNDAMEASSAHERIAGTAAERLVWAVAGTEALADERCVANEYDELVRRVWEDVVGLRGICQDGGRVRICVPTSCDLAFAQGTLMMPCGMMFIRWDRVGDGLELRVSLPPGVCGTLGIGSTTRDVGSGRHVLRAAKGGKV